MARERMDPQFSVFNCHVNSAKLRANEEFIRQYSKELFDTYIAPLHETGIMEIFEASSDKKTLHMRVAWITLCTAYVNQVQVRAYQDGT